LSAPSPAHSSQFFTQFPLSQQILGMKFAFENKTEPTLCAAIIIAVAITSSGALATIAVSLDNPSVAIYSITILVLIIWIAITKISP
jgi:hypothetical protein